MVSEYLPHFTQAESHFSFLTFHTSTRSTFFPASICYGSTCQTNPLATAHQPSTQKKFFTFHFSLFIFHSSLFIFHSSLFTLHLILPHDL
jgi:hypothetical protein